jgi:hypothetical protein
VREILIAAGASATALAIVAVVVFAAHDTGLFVPPPEAVAEDFGRMLASKRYELARGHLSSGARAQQSARIVEERFEPVRQRIGKLNHTEAFELSRERDRASAMCELQGENATVALMLVLTREQGLWAVESWELAAETTP